MRNSNTLGNRIKSLREDKAMSQLELAKVLHIGNTTLSQYESDKRVPSDTVKKKLAEYFNVSLDYLMGVSNKKEPEIGLNVPKEYSDKYKVTSRDKKQYIKEMEKANEAFFLNDELNENAKKEMLDLMSELFWKAKALNKRKPKK